MAKAQYFGVGGVARKVKSIPFGIGNVARNVKSGYFGVGGVARQFLQGGITLGDLDVGTVVKLNEHGTPQEYIIVNKGNPDGSKYDSTCDGIWLMRNLLHSVHKWHSSGLQDYSACDIHNYINKYFIKFFDSNIQNSIKTVKIPYYDGDTTHVLSNGVSCKLFLLSGYEIGSTSTSPFLPYDGAALSYFNGDLDSKRIAYLDGSADYWWTRSPDYASTYICYVNSYGAINSKLPNYTYGLRPALIMPYDLLVDDEMNIIAA